MLAAGVVALCTVFAVSDGDTVRVRCGDGDQIRVRLAEIDAPESKQPFGARAKEALSDMVFKREVILKSNGPDRYGRVIGTLFIGQTNINASMVQQGYAWCYRQYLSKNNQWCLPLEEAAKSTQRGLWADQAPVAPWVWRQAKRG